MRNLGIAAGLAFSIALAASPSVFVLDRPETFAAAPCGASLSPDEAVKAEEALEKSSWLHSLWFGPKPGQSIWQGQRTWHRIQPHEYISQVIKDANLYAVQVRGDQESWCNLLVGIRAGQGYVLPEQLNQLLWDGGMTFSVEDIGAWARICILLGATTAEMGLRSDGEDDGAPSGFRGIPSLTIEHIEIDPYHKGLFGYGAAKARTAAGQTIELQIETTRGAPPYDTTTHYFPAGLRRLPATGEFMLIFSPRSEVDGDPPTWQVLREPENLANRYEVDELVTSYNWEGKKYTRNALYITVEENGQPLGVRKLCYKITGLGSQSGDFYAYIRECSWGETRDTSPIYEASAAVGGRGGGVSACGPAVTPAA